MCLPQLLALSRIRHTTRPQSEVLGVSKAHRARGSTILYATRGLCPSLCGQDLQQMQELWAGP